MRVSASVATILLMMSPVTVSHAVDKTDLPTRDDIAFVFDGDSPDDVRVSSVQRNESVTRTAPRRCRPRLAAGSISGWQKVAAAPGGANKWPQIAQIRAIEYPDAQTASAAFRKYLTRWASCKRYRLSSKGSQEYEVVVRKKLKRVSDSRARVRILISGYVLQSIWEWIEVRDRHVVVSSESNYRTIDRDRAKPARWPQLWDVKTLAAMTFDRVEGVS